MKIKLNDKSYSYFRSSIDHLWNSGYRRQLFSKLKEDYDLMTMTPVMQRYILGLNEYIKNEYGIFIKENIEFVLYTDNDLVFTEGAEEMIKVFGREKREEIVRNAIPEFTLYNIVVNSVFNAN